MDFVYPTSWIVLFFLFLFLSAGLAYIDNIGAPLLIPDATRNVAPSVSSSFAPSTPSTWYGKVVPSDANGDYTNIEIATLQAGAYQLKFSALKHFADPSNRSNFEVYYSPPFNIQF
jgi:hypothetical protein